MTIVKQAPVFVDLETSRTAYERASQALPKVRENLIEPFKALVYEAAGIDPYQMETDVVRVPVRAGNVRFEFQVERRIATPAYKGIVEGWYAYVNGVNLLAGERTITGVIRRDGRNYVSAESVRDELVIRAYGMLKVGLEFNMVNHEGISGLEEIVVPESAEEVRLDGKYANAYWNALQIVDGMEMLVSTYARAVKKAEKRNGKKGVAVTQKTAYESKTVDQERANWAGVVKTLIHMPTDRGDDEKELDELADETVSIKERVEEWGHVYDLARHTPYGEMKLYVGLNSVAARIQELKTDKTKVEQVTAKHRERL